MPPDPLTIAVCRRGMTRILDALREVLPGDEIVECDPDEVTATAREADVLVPITAPVTAAAFDGTRVRLVQQFGVGLDSVDVAAATDAGVLVANVPSGGTGNAESVGELTVALMVMLGRQLPTALQHFRERRVGSPVGDCLWGSTVVILGYGGVGEAVARCLAGFVARVIAVSRHGPDGGRARDASVPLARHVGTGRLHEVITEADYLVVAAPATRDNVGLVDRALLGRIKPGAFLVNVARGPVVDYDALLGALRSGRLAGAGLDVFWQEPFDPDDPLLAENVIALPHVGGVTARSFRGIGEAVARNVERFRRGELPEHCVNPGAADARASGGTAKH